MLLKKMLICTLIIIFILSLGITVNAENETVTNTSSASRKVIQEILAGLKDISTENNFTESYKYDDQYRVIERSRTLDNLVEVTTYTYHNDDTYSKTTSVSSVIQKKQSLQSYSLQMGEGADGLMNVPDMQYKIDQYSDLWWAAWGNGNLTEEQKQEAEKKAHLMANIARADYCVRYPYSDFAKAFLENDSLETGTAFRREMSYDVDTQYKDVMAVQRALIAYGYLDVADVPFDEYGYYGMSTQAAVHDYQYDNLGFSTGVVSTKTIRLLFNSSNQTQRSQATFEEFANINMFRTRHDAVRDAVYNQVKTWDSTMYREGYLYKAGRKGNGGRFDLARKRLNTTHVWEIKPDSSYGQYTGKDQIDSYVRASRLPENSDKEYKNMVYGFNITPDSILWNESELVRFGNICRNGYNYNGLVFYYTVKDGEPVAEVLPAPSFVRPNQDYSQTPWPSAAIIPQGVSAVTLGILITIIVVKGIIAFSLAGPTAGGSFLVFAF